MMSSETKKWSSGIRTKGVSETEGINVRAPSARRASTADAGEMSRRRDSGRPAAVRSPSMTVSSAASRSERTSCPERQRASRPSASRLGSSWLFHDRIPPLEQKACFCSFLDCSTPSSEQNGAFCSYRGCKGTSCEQKRGFCSPRGECGSAEPGKAREWAPGPRPT